MSNSFSVIATYSRKEAIEDGVLIDISKLAMEAGFKCNVCVTAAVWNLINNIPDEYEYQDVIGRQWDMLNVLFIRARNCELSTINFTFEMPYEKTILNKNDEKVRVVEKI